MDMQVPFDLTAERATLGALLMEREAIVALASWLRPEHFYLEKHALIYEAVLACYQRREPPDLATVAAELRRHERLELVGGVSALGQMVVEVPTAFHVEYYGRIVERTAVGRALVEAGGHVSALGFDDRRSIEERLNDAGQIIYQLSAARQLGQDFVPISHVASQYLDTVHQADEEYEGLLGVATGFPDLDRITMGMKPGELIVLAARPGVGKTALALTMAYHVARQQRRVGIFSLEMDRELLLQRLVALDQGLPTTAIPRLVRRGDRRVIDALARIAALPIWIDHSPGLASLAIRDRARRLSADEAVDLWIIDYLQLARSENERDDEVRRITQISQHLTHMARELRTPVLALSQLSRAVESRAAHIPMLSDLRGSGSIEQDASQVWFIYREELYDTATDLKGVAEVHVAKHRNGETGVVSLHFEAHTTRFWSRTSRAPR